MQPSLSRATPSMRVVAEIHLPGLGLSQKRWTSHSIFMSEVYRNIDTVRAQAQRDQEAYGAGVLFVDKQGWLRLVRRSFEETKSDIVLEYVPRAEICARVDFGPLQEAFLSILESYDAEAHFVLVACHHPSDLLSCYLFASEAAGADQGDTISGALEAAALASSD